MTLFLIGAIGILAVCVGGCFLPCYYTEGWGYASLGVVESYATSERQTYRLLDDNINSGLIYFLLAVIIVGLATYTILMLLKKSNLVSSVVIFILAIAPFLLMLFNVGQLKEEGEYLKTSAGLVIGAGIRSGLTEIGAFLMAASIAFFIVLVVGFNINHRKLLKEAEEQPMQAPKEIKVKKPAKQKVSENDFRIK